MPTGLVPLLTRVSLILPLPEAAELPAIAALLHEKVTPEAGVAVGV